MGFKLKSGKHYDSNIFLAGSNEDCAQDVMEFFNDFEIKAILATRREQGASK